MKSDFYITANSEMETIILNNSFQSVDNAIDHHTIRLAIQDYRVFYFNGPMKAEQTINTNSSPLIAIDVYGIIKGVTGVVGNIDKKGIFTSTLEKDEKEVFCYTPYRINLLGAMRI